MKLEYIENAIYEAIRLKIVERGYLPDETLYLPNNSAGYKAAIDAIKASGKKIIYLENTGSYKGREDLEENCIILDIEDFAPSQTGTKSIPVYTYNEANDNYDKTLTAEGIYDLEYRVTMVVYDAKYIQIIHEIIQSALKFRQELSAIDEDGAALSETFVLWRRNYIPLDSKKFAERSIFYEVPSVDIDGCTDVGTVAKNIEIEIEVAPSDETILADVSQVFLTTKAGTGGSVIPEYTDEPFRLGDFSSVFGLADNGYRFLKWIEEVLLNPATILMNRTKILTAEFIQQFQLTTSVSGNGSITPSSGIYDDGDIVDLTVTPDPDNEIDRVEEDNIPIEYPYQVLMNTAKTVIAYIVAIYTAIQDVFTTEPTKIGLNWYFNDSINSNNIKIKSVAANFKDLTSVGLGNIPSTHVQNHIIKFNIYDFVSGSNQGIYCIGGRIGNLFSGISIYASVSSINITSAVSTASQSVHSWSGNINDKDIIINITETNIIVTADGSEIINDSKVATYFNATYNNYIAAIRNVTVEPTLQLVAKMKYLQHDVGGNFYITEGQGSTLYNDNEINNGTIININSDFWLNKTYEKESYPYTKGTTLYINDSDTSIMPLSFDTSQIISGFTKDAFYPSGSGVLNEVSSFIFPESQALSDNQELRDAGIYSYTPDLDKKKALWDGATTYNITADGLGDYPTIRAAILSQNGTDHIKINVQAGTYNENDIVGVNNVWVCCLGVVIVNSDGLSTDISPSDYSFPTYASTAYNLIPQAFKHNCYIVASMLVTGIKLIGNDIKYNVHQDATGIYESQFDDFEFIKVENNNITYPNNVGIGGRVNQKQIFTNGTMELQTTLTPDVNSARVFYHNDDAQLGSTYMLLSNIEAVNGHLLITSEQESGHVDVVTVDSCTIAEVGKGIVYTAFAPTHIYNLWIVVNNTTYVLTKLNRDDADILEITDDIDVIGDIANYGSSGIFPGATPQEVEYSNINSLVDSVLIQITKDINRVSQLIIKE